MAYSDHTYVKEYVLNERSEDENDPSDKALTRNDAQDSGEQNHTVYFLGKLHWNGTKPKLILQNTRKAQCCPNACIAEH